MWSYFGVYLLVTAVLVQGNIVCTVPTMLC